MREYRVGEVFTVGDGKTVQCVRSNGSCNGCVFLTKIVCAPQCRARGIDCSKYSREDGQHVIFEELEELKGHTDYPIGKVLAFEGDVVEVISNNDERSCDGCVLINYLRCHTVPCTPAERVADNYIKFKKHVTEE